MFVIFGWCEGSSQDHGPTLLIDCPNCHNKGYWHLYKSKMWFSLFFVPIIPYESLFRLLCETCSSGIELNGGEVEAALNLNQEAVKVIQKRKRVKSLHLSFY